MRSTAYKPAAITITNASKKILPAREYPGATAWTAGETVAYGTVRQLSDGTQVWCVVAGDTDGTTEPTASELDFTDGTVTWRIVHNDRNQFIIVNHSAVAIFLGFGFAAEASRGVKLAAGGSFNSSSLNQCPNCDVYAIAESAGNQVVGIQEF